jgi:hypothetical protein
MTDERETDEAEAESREEQIDEQGRNPTQQRMDEEGVEAAPVDTSWSGEAETSSTEVAGADPSGPVDGADQGAPVAAAGPAVPGGSFETSAHAAASEPATSLDAPAGTNEPIFEPDVPLEAEVNREAAAGGSRKGVIAGVAGVFALLGAVLLRRRR